MMVTFQRPSYGCCASAGAADDIVAVKKANKDKRMRSKRIEGNPQDDVMAALSATNVSKVCAVRSCPYIRVLQRTECAPVPDCCKESCLPQLSFGALVANCSSW